MFRRNRNRRLTRFDIDFRSTRPASKIINIFLYLLILSPRKANIYTYTQVYEYRVINYTCFHRYRD